MPTSRTLGLTFLLSSLALCAALTPAQQNQTGTPTQPTPAPSPTPFSKKLNVIVLDKNGAPVSDLRQEDFQVFEDGTPQTITSLAHAETPVSYALVMDCTGSMRSQIDQEVRTGAVILTGNRNGDETAIVRFISSDKINMMQTFTADQAELTKALKSLYVEGGQSAVIDAVYLAAVYVTARSRQDENRHRALVLLTDGEDRASYYKLSDLQKYLAWTDVQVFSIGFGQESGKQSGFLSGRSREKAEKLLNTLAEETGGRVFYPKRLEQLRDAVEAIQHDLHTEYVVSYTPTNQTRDDRVRKIEIKLADKPGAGKHTVIARTSYVAAKEAPAAAKDMEKHFKP
jgi:Ca-activated chloride channel homolog